MDSAIFMRPPDNGYGVARVIALTASKGNNGYGVMIVTVLINPRDFNPYQLAHIPLCERQLAFNKKRQSNENK
jgi:hypothetical protein